MLCCGASQSYRTHDMYCVRIAHVKKRSVIFSNGGRFKTLYGFRQVADMDQDKNLCFASFCFLHQVHLTCSATLEPSLPVVSRLYSISRLLRCPGYMQKLLNAVLPVVHHDLDIKFDQKCDLDSYREYNMAILRLCGIDPLAQESQQLLGLLNAPWHWSRITHICSGVGCPCGSFLSASPLQQFASNVAELVKETLFSNMPPVPISARWTKVASTLGWCTLLCSIHRLLPKCFSAAFDSTFIKGVLARAAAAVMPESCAEEPKMGGAEREQWIAEVSSRFLDKSCF